MGETSPGDDIVITIIADGRTNELAETIILSMVIDSPDDVPSDLMLGNSNLSFAIPADLPLPSVSLSADNTSITEGNTATITLTLNEALDDNATFNLIGGGTGATYGTSNDWNLSVGGTDCGMATESNPCQITISQRETTAEVTVEVNTDTIDETSPKTFTVSVEVASGSTSIVQEGSQSSLSFTIPADPVELPTVSLNYSGSTTISVNGNLMMNIALSETITEEITINIIGDTSTATYSNVGFGWSLNPRNANNISCTSVSGTNCQAIIPAGETSRTLSLTYFGTTAGENIVLSIRVDPASQNLVALGTPSTQTLTIQ